MPDKRILLVEDDPQIRALLALVLRREGYETDEAETVGGAMSLLDSRHYDLALVDWRVPDGDGLLVADTAAQLGAQTVVMSGYLPEMRGGRAYGHHSMMKPVLPAEVIALVRSAIGESGKRA